MAGRIAVADCRNADPTALHDGARFRRQTAAPGGAARGGGDPRSRAAGAEVVWRQDYQDRGGTIVMFGGNAGNMAGMMKKVQKMQADMMKVQEELKQRCEAN